MAAASGAELQGWATEMPCLLPSPTLLGLGFTPSGMGRSWATACRKARCQGQLTADSHRKIPKHLLPLCCVGQGR